jgi:hypothetical protein
MSYEMLESYLESLVELTDAELDAVAAGADHHGRHGSLINVQVFDVNLNVLTGNNQND